MLVYFKYIYPSEMVIPYHSQLTSNLTVLFILSFDSCCLNIQLKKIPIVLHMFCNPKNKHRTCKNIPLKKNRNIFQTPILGFHVCFSGGVLHLTYPPFNKGFPLFLSEALPCWPHHLYPAPRWKLAFQRWYLSNLRAISSHHQKTCWSRQEVMNSHRTWTRWR